MLRVVIFLLALAVGTPLTHAGAIQDAMQDCIQSKNLDRTIRGCTKLIKSGRLDRKSRPGAYYNRGNAYNKKGLYDRAITDFDKTIELIPRFANAYNSRGIAYNKKGLYDRAITDFDKGIKLNPKHANTYNNRGNAYVYKGQTDRAIADYDKAIKLNPKLADAYNNRGSAYYEKKGDRDKAIADFRKAIELRPGNETAKRGLKRLGVTP